MKARAAAELRREQLDSKRKKLKQDLEDRELAASHEKEYEVKATRNLAAEVGPFKTMECCRRNIVQK